MFFLFFPFWQFFSISRRNGQRSIGSFVYVVVGDGVSWEVFEYLKFETISELRIFVYLVLFQFWISGTVVLS